MTIDDVQTRGPPPSLYGHHWFNRSRTQAPIGRPIGEFQLLAHSALLNTVLVCCALLVATSARTAGVALVEPKNKLVADYSGP